jgi:primary-amine oxidase
VEHLNENELNAVGKPVAYSLHPEGNPLLLAADDSSIARRSAFATNTSG